MIQVKIVANLTRKTISTPSTSTIRQILEANEIDYSTAPVYVDGAPLGVGEHDKTLAELGITEKCVLSAVVKTTNA